MTKKSFFERLTGATKEEILADQFQNEIIPPKKTDVEEPEQFKEEKSEIESIENGWSHEEEGQLMIDVYQTDTDIIVKSTIAGVKSEDLDIKMTDNMITIKGIRQKDKSIPQKNYNYQEIYWGPFSRSVILPVEINSDKIKASMKDGILTIRLPKMEKFETKTIQVKEME